MTHQELFFEVARECKELEKELTEVKHQNQLMRNYLLHEWKRGALSGPMDNDLINAISLQTVDETPQ